MNFSLNAYQHDALSFRLPSATPEYALLNLPGEVGELLSLKAKAIRDGRNTFHDHDVKKELGDILWMVAAIASDHGFTLENVALSNIMKLSLRKDAGTLQGSGDAR